MAQERDTKMLALIYNVRVHPELYDYRLPEYRDSILKKNTWSEIATRTFLPNGDVAKSHWLDLLRSFTVFYRNELIRLVRAYYNEEDVGPLPKESKDASGYNRPWAYYSDMRFVAPFRVKGENPEMDRLIALAKPIVCKDAKPYKCKPVKSVAAPKVDSEMPAPCDPKERNEQPLLGLDVPSINEEDLSPDDKCVRSFFDFLYRSTCLLPTHLRNRVRREMLESVNKAEAEAEAAGDSED